MRPWRWLGGSLLATWLALPALADVAVPALERRVTDLSATLSSAQRDELEQQLATFEQQKGSQIALLILPTTEPETIEAYAIRVAEAWKLGRAGVDDGVLLLVAVEDRTLRIEVGYGLEGVVPDAIARRIISEVITPHFRNGDYFGGLRAGIERLIGVIEGEPLPEPEPDWRNSRDSVEGILPFLLMIAVLLGRVLRRVFGRPGSAGVVGVVAGGIVWFVIGLLSIAVIAGVMAFVLTLVGNAPGRRWISGGRGGSGGMGSWGGGGSRGGGGFSGGGGGFGGGGASGRW